MQVSAYSHTARKRPRGRQSSEPRLCLLGSNQELIHPLENQIAHLGKFDVFTIEKLDATIGFPAMLPAKREQVVANLLDSGGRGQRIAAAVHTQVRTGHNQFVNIRGLKVLQQRRNVVREQAPPHSDQGLIARARMLHVLLCSSAWPGRACVAKAGLQAIPKAFCGAASDNARKILLVLMRHLVAGRVGPLLPEQSHGGTLQKLPSCRRLASRCHSLLRTSVVYLDTFTNQKAALSDGRIANNRD